MRSTNAYLPIYLLYVHLCTGYRSLPQLRIKTCISGESFESRLVPVEAKYSKVRPYVGLRYAFYYAPAQEALSDDAVWRLSDVCLSVCLSRTSGITRE